MSSLLAEFLKDDCDRHVRGLLMQSIQQASAPERQFTFNRFDVKLDFASKSALIQDVLDPSPNGSCVVSLCEFAAALSNHSPTV